MPSLSSADLSRLSCKQGSGKEAGKSAKENQEGRHPLVSRVQLFATPWTVADQVPLSMGFSRQEYWSGLPFPSPRDLPHPGIEPGSPTLQADSLPSEPPGKLHYA